MISRCLLALGLILCVELPQAQANDTTTAGGGGGFSLFGRRNTAGSRLVQAARRITRCSNQISYCFNARGACGRPQINNQGVRINQSLDCSGFLSAVFGMAGVRIHNRQDPSAFMATTRDFNRAACLPAAQLSNNSPLQEGDLINISGSPGHVVMVSQVGRDPFSCRNPHPGNFNFRVMHSSRGTGGPAEVHPAQLDRRFTNILNDIAQRACRGQSFTHPNVRRAANECVTNPLNYSINGGRC